ncbi:MAG: hypothetical protein KJ077_19920 [Anaerolineae bacterium]|nr:hypothetical protein [Anaerolineae bacterium]
MAKNSFSIPLLVVEDVYPDEVESQRLIGIVRIGGHPVRVILDFGRQDLGFIEYVQLPGLLGMHPPSQQAVVNLMSRVYEGETIQFPVDFSEEIRQASPPSPFEPMSTEDRVALEAAANQVHLDIVTIEQIVSEPLRFTVTLRLDGQLMTIQVELFAGPQRVPVMRWLKGPDPNSLSVAQRYAIQRALLSRYETE